MKYFFYIAPQINKKMNTKNIFIRAFILTAFLGLCLTAQSQNADNSQIKTVKFTVEGMHCGGCATNIENSLGKKDGVLSAKVNFTDKTAEIQYDGTKFRESDLIASIEHIGFKASVYEGDVKTEDSSSKNCEHNKASCGKNKTCCKKSAKN